MTAQPQRSGGPGSGTLLRRRLLALLALGAPGMLGACGKKGPLRLPEPPPESASESAPKSSDEETK